LVAARARSEGADTLLTVGGLQSNHARATAATAARLGLRCVLILNGARPDRPTGNTLLDGLLGAEIEYVSSRAERAPAMQAAADRLRAQGRRPFEIPLGASTPLGAIAYARAVAELVGEGYGIPTPASREALELAARTEALFLDSTYTAKAMAGLMAHVRAGRFRSDETVLFWHTGGQVGLLA